MGEVMVSVRVDEGLHAEMKYHDEINWSAILRKAIAEQVQKLEHINESTAHHALQKILELRTMKIFDGGKKTTEIIREWREKRK